MKVVTDDPLELRQQRARRVIANGDDDAWTHADEFRSQELGVARDLGGGRRLHAERLDEIADIEGVARQAQHLPDPRPQLLAGGPDEAAPLMVFFDTGALTQNEKRTRHRAVAEDALH